MGFMCADCGGNVADNQRVGPDATWTLRGGATIPFPQTVRLPVCEECGERYLSKLAIDAVETALSEMHDALVEHFAPVLRWSKEDNGYTARVGEWWLSARPGEWTVTAYGSDGPTRYEMCLRTDILTAEIKRRAEAALRSLGVAFRVEGES